jgi:hypothetical protein
MNSIKTGNGIKPKGQPAGTNNEKKSKPCFCFIFSFFIITYIDRLSL